MILRITKDVSGSEASRTSRKLGWSSGSLHPDRILEV